MEVIVVEPAPHRVFFTLILEVLLKQKRRLEADLDPPNTPRTRPGGETAKRALALAKGDSGERKKGTEKTRPGAYAANRASTEIRRRRDAGK